MYSEKIVLRIDLEKRKEDFVWLFNIWENRKNRGGKKMKRYIAVIAMSVLMLCSPSFAKEPAERNYDTLAANLQAQVATKHSYSDIQKRFSNFTSKKATRPLGWARIGGPNNAFIPLDKFAQATNLKINPKLKKLLKNNDYDVFSCASPSGTSFGFFVSLKLMPHYQGNLFKDEVRFMKEWEPTLLRDTAKVIFPNMNFTQEELRQPLIFSSGQHSSATIKLPGGMSGSINYTLVDDFIIISSSRECLNKASLELFAQED